MRQGQDYGGTQDRGSRDYQEDAFHFQPLPGAYGDTDGVLLTLSDGMGGCNAGGHASTLAVKAFVQTYLAAAEERREADRLHRALLAANQQMARDARSNPDLRGMGCTLIGASLTAAGLQFVSVGDSLVLL